MSVSKVTTPDLSVNRHPLLMEADQAYRDHKSHQAYLANEEKAQIRRAAADGLRVRIESGLGRTLNPVSFKWYRDEKGEEFPAAEIAGLEFGLDWRNEKLILCIVDHCGHCGHATFGSPVGTLTDLGIYLNEGPSVVHVCPPAKRAAA